MKMLYTVCRRIHRIVMMPDYVMGVEPSQRVVKSTPLVETRATE